MADLNNSLLRITDNFKSIFGTNSTVPGSKLYQIGEAIAYESYLAADTIDTFIYNNSLATATGQALDNIGSNFFGIDRIKSSSPVISASMKAIKFYTSNGVTFGTINQINGVGSDIIVNEGTLITGMNNNTEYVFRVTSNTVLHASSNEAYVPAEMLNGDTNLIPSNTLTSHNCTTYSTSALNFLLVTNPVAIGLSAAEESDNNYRYRLANSLKAREITSFYGIKNDLLQLPGVSNIEIIPGSYGGGTFTAIVQGITPITSDDLIELVRQRLSNIVPPWVYYTVEKPNYIGLTVSIGINISTADVISSSIVTALQRSIADYINNFYGTTFDLQMLQSIAQQSLPSSYIATLNSVQIYTGNGEFRMYEDFDLTNVDKTIYISSIDKLIVETDLFEPISIEAML
jgi:hypothetical protein